MPKVHGLIYHSRAVLLHFQQFIINFAEVHFGHDLLNGVANLKDFELDKVRVVVARDRIFKNEMA